MSTVSTTVTGTASSDTIKTSSGDDIINAGAGNDIVYAGAGNDTLDGGSGSDWVDGGAGNDFFTYTFEAATTVDTYIGGSGYDSLQIRISKADADRSNLSQQIAAFTQLVAAQATSGGNLAEGKPATFTFTFWNGATLTVSTIESAVVFITDSPATGTVTLQSAAEGLVAGLAVNLADPDGPITAWSYELQVKVGAGDWQTVVTTSDPASIVIPDDQALVDGLARVRVTTTDDKGGVTVVDSNAAVIVNVDDEAQGVLKVAGTPAEGGTLTASLDGASDIDGAVTAIAYRWQREVGGQWQDIAGANSATLSIPGDQSLVGQHVRVVATTTDARGGTTDFTFDATVANSDDPTTGTPVITNTSGQPVSAVLEGATLRADLSGLQDADGLDLSTATYAWQRLDLRRGGWQPLLGPDGLPLTTAQVTMPDTQAWVGQTIRVTVTVPDAYGNSTSVASDAFVVQNVDDPTTGRFIFARDTQFVEGGRSELQLRDVWDLDHGPAPDPYASAAPDTDVVFNITYQLETSLDGQQWTAYGPACSHYYDVMVPSGQEYVGQQVRVVAVTTDRFGNTTRFVSTDDDDRLPAPLTIVNADDEATGELVVRAVPGGFDGGVRGEIIEVIDDDPGDSGESGDHPPVAEGGQLRVALSGWSDEDNTPAFQPFDPEAVPIPPRQVTYELQVLENDEWVTLPAYTRVLDQEDQLKYLVTLNVPDEQSFIGRLLRVVATSEDLLGGTTVFTGEAFRMVNTDDEARLAGGQPLVLQGTTMVDGEAVAYESSPGVPPNVLSVDLAALGLSDEDGAITALAMQWFVMGEDGFWYPQGDSIEWQAPADGTPGPFPAATLAIPDTEELVGRQVMLEVYTLDALGGTSRLTSNTVTIQGVYDVPADPGFGYLKPVAGISGGSPMLPVLARLPAELAAEDVRYQWWSQTGVDAWTPIAGATSLHYAPILTEASTGTRLRLMASDAAGNELWTTNDFAIGATSDGVNHLFDLPLEQQGNLLIAKNASEISDPDGGTIATSYEWRVGVSNAGFFNSRVLPETDSVLDLSKHMIDANARVYVQITMIDSFGSMFVQTQNLLVQADARTFVEPVAIPGGILGISGSWGLGGTLSASTQGLALPPGTSLGSFGWEAYRGAQWTPLSGMQDASLLLDPSLLAEGEYVRARVTALSSDGTETLLYSTAQRVTITEDPAPEDIAAGAKSYSLTFYASEDRDIVADITQVRRIGADSPQVRFVIDGTHVDGAVDEFLNFRTSNLIFGAYSDQIYLANDAGSAFQGLPTVISSAPPVPGLAVIAAEAFQAFDSALTGADLPAFDATTRIAFDRSTGAVWFIDPDGPDSHFLTVTGATALSHLDFAVGSLASAATGW